VGGEEVGENDKQGGIEELIGEPAAENPKAEGPEGIDRVRGRHCREFVVGLGRGKRKVVLKDWTNWHGEGEPANRMSGGKMTQGKRRRINSHTWGNVGDTRHRGRRTENKPKL